MPMPPSAIPDLPARNPPFTPAPGPAESPGLSSRVVRALAGQTVEVPFRGTGWVYLGEAASKRGIDYAARRLDGEGQTFVFRAAETGVYGLKFYRQDFIRDYIINDLVTVIVEEPSPAASVSPSPRSGAVTEQDTVRASPRWPLIAGRTTPETEAAPGTGSPAPASRPEPAASGAVSQVRPESAATGVASSKAVPAAPEPVVSGTAVPGAPPAATLDTTLVGDAQSAETSLILPEDTAAEEYLRRAREEYQGERFLQSAAILDQFLARFPLGSDEAYWLYAQLCEKQGPSRNIRLALDYYRRLTAGYPQSGHYNDARRRIAYLERYYINIQ
jgi:hypothetical protein